MIGSPLTTLAEGYESEAAVQLRQWCVYPGRQLMTARMAVSMPIYSILMEMQDGRIWFISISQRNIPTQEVLEKIAAVLHLPEVSSSSNSLVESWLFDQVRIVAKIRSDDIESASSWDSELKAMFLDTVMRAESTGSQDILKIRQRIEQDWSEDLVRFVDMLDPEAVALARSAGGLLPDHYNFLVAEDAIISRNRRQASECFPLLLPNLAANSSYARIRGVVDRGEPLVDHLAGFYGVAKSTVKSLVELPLSFVSIDWHSRVGEFLRLLGDIAPEFRPGSFDEWRRFFETVEFIVRISRMPASTIHNRLWLRACSRTRFRLPDGDFPDVEVVARVIDDFLSGLRDALQWETEDSLGQSVSELVFQRLINHASVSLGGLDKMQRLGRKYGEVLRHEEQLFQRHDRDLILGIRWHSPLPEGLVCYQITIVPLCTPDELIQEAQSMKSCVGGYSGRCLRGESQIWSLRQEDGRPVSTLETVIEWKNDRLVPKIVQHRGLSNAWTERKCDMAASQLIRHLSGKQESLEGYWRWKVSVSNLSRNNREMMVLTKPIIATLKAILPVKISFESLVEMGRSLAMKQEAKKCR